MNPAAPYRVGVYCSHTENHERALRLAVSLDLPVVTVRGECELVLFFADDRLVLSPADSCCGAIAAEFVSGPAGYRRAHRRKEALLKAVGFHPHHSLTVLDATGGLGRDGFLMAAYGCQVDIYERDPIVAALLADGLRRAAAHVETAEITGRIRLTVGDSLHLLREVGHKSRDVIYLDPMFPGRSKSALVKKEMQILQRLLGNEEDDTPELFAAALSAAGRRVVVKRPWSAPPLAGPAPSHSISGKTTRFDIYLC